MIIRTYFSKNNTVVSNSPLNTGLNPVTELFYGDNYSRFLFKFDTDKLKTLYTGGTFTDISKLKHTLKLTNTASFDKKLLNGTMGAKSRTNSFDLIVLPITQDWDEGTGYDFDDTMYLEGLSSISTTPSNWINPKRNVSWLNGLGVYSGLTASFDIVTQHFDHGNENMEVDITNYVNGLLTGATNNGLMITFQKVYEDTITNTLQYVGFFTRHTQTIYEPCVETVYSNYIKDDRNNFFLDKPCKLYLYVNVGGNPTNLDILPTVEVYDNNEIVIATYVGSNVTHVTKGVYSIDLIIPTTQNNVDCTMFTDVWSNITINGVARPDISLNFALKDSLGYYNVGDQYPLSNGVAISVSGVKNMEKIKRGDTRKIIVSARIPYTVEQTQNVTSLKYRIYTLEGKNQLTLIDFHPIEMTNNYNYFLLDTASLLPSIYYIDILSETNLEVNTITAPIAFEILSESNLRNSQ